MIEYQDGSYEQRIDQAKLLLLETRHLALATVNADGSPHNSPVFFAFDKQLNFYWLSELTALHSLNIARNSSVFIVVFDSHRRGGGLYIQAHARSVALEPEHTTGLEVVNDRRKVWGQPPADLETKDWVYRAIPTRFWVNVSEIQPDGSYLNEYRREVMAHQLLK